jgi:hypothetical protein
MLQRTLAAAFEMRVLSAASCWVLHDVHSSVRSGVDTEAVVSVSTLRGVAVVLHASLTTDVRLRSAKLCFCRSFSVVGMLSIHLELAMRCRASVNGHGHVEAYSQLSVVVD